MINNFIGGGQVFLHKVRMLKQVAGSTMIAALLSGVLGASFLNKESLSRIDVDASLTFVKAKTLVVMHPALSAISIGKNRPKVDAYSNNQLFKKRMDASYVLTSNKFQHAWKDAVITLRKLCLQIFFFSCGIGFCIFLIWHKFGRNLQEEKAQDGSGVLLTANEVRSNLNFLGKTSDLKIGKMPLVKDMETRHFLITGSTGSGKTNFIDNLLPQVERRKQPAIVVDQTGEMISKYYNEARGDIIFNPFDTRGHEWDFWADCFDSGSNINGVNDRLEKFAKILFSFNRKNSNSNSDPFWENSAEVVFTSCAQYLFENDQKDITALQYMLQKQGLGSLAHELKQTPASRYLNLENKLTANSILSVLSSSSKPLNYLAGDKNHKSFSLIKYLQGVKNGSDAWLFLATKPSQRELTLPLIACLTELAVSLLMENGIQKDQKLWFILDELAALGKLPALGGLMSEGRKYGACVVAAMQSLNQLYLNYGGYGGSAIFGQFGSKFFFRNDEPQIAKMISDMCGTETINKQQKNTSFGANEFRDGVSYTEQERQKKLVEYNDVASLDVGECYVLLPESKVRLAKIKVPESKLPKKNIEFDASKDVRSNLLDTDREVDLEEELVIAPIIPNHELSVKNTSKPQVKEMSDDNYEFEVLKN